MIKEEKTKVIALLTAGGTGTRTNQDIPKQFFHINNKPLIVYTMEAFEKHPAVDEIIVVCLDGWHEILKAYAKQFNITKLKYVVSGGATGQESIYNGLKELEKHCNKDDAVIVHDGNRALVSDEIINGALSTYYKHGSAVVAIPCTEVVFMSEGQEESQTEIPREKLLRTQTPHIYSLGKLLWAHQQAKEKNLTSMAASCSLMRELGETTYFSKGSEMNFKITTLDDLDMFKAVLNTEKESWIK